MASALPIIVETFDSAEESASLTALPDADAPPGRTDSMISLAYYHLRRQGAALEREGRRLGEVQAPDAVHAMRIATRKLRAALKTFKPLLPGPERRALAAELRWLARELSELRDLDVYADNAGTYLRDLPETDREVARRHLDELAESRRHAARHAGATLASARYRDLLARLAAFTRDAPTPAERRRWESFRVCDGIDPYLKRGLRRVHKRARRVRDEGTAEALHALRIEGKRYRYLLEFFAPLYGKALEKPLKGVRRLHRVLGKHQDACVAEARMRDYASRANSSEHTPEEFLALGRLLDAYAARAAAIRARFRKLWRRFEKAEPRFPIAD